MKDLKDRSIKLYLYQRKKGFNPGTKKKVRKHLRELKKAIYQAYLKTFGPVVATYKEILVPELERLLGVMGLSGQQIDDILEDAGKRIYSLHADEINKRRKLLEKKRISHDLLEYPNHAVYPEEKAHPLSYLPRQFHFETKEIGFNEDVGDFPNLSNLVE